MLDKKKICMNDSTKKAKFVWLLKLHNSAKIFPSGGVNPIPLRKLNLHGPLRSFSKMQKSNARKVFVM